MMAMLSCLMFWKYATMLIPRGPTCIVPMPPAMVVPPARLMAGGLFLCLNQVMLSSSLSCHQGLVLYHCKNEYRHIYTKTKSIQVPGSLHMQWARGEEFSWSSWRCRSVATDRSSHPVGLSEGEERNGLLLYGAYMSLTSKGFITTSPLSPHLTTFYTFYPSSFYSSPAMEIKSQVPFRMVGAKKWRKQTPPRPKSGHSETIASIGILSQFWTFLKAISQKNLFSQGLRYDRMTLL